MIYMLVVIRHNYRLCLMYMWLSLLGCWNS